MLDNLPSFVLEVLGDRGDESSQVNEDGIAMEGNTIHRSMLFCLVMLQWHQSFLLKLMTAPQPVFLILVQVIPV